MTHRQIIDLAGWLAEHGPIVVENRRGIPVAALRRYLNAKQAQHQAWGELLAQTTGLQAGYSAAKTGTAIISALQEIATARVLVRVASTVLYAIGKRHDVPLAIDVADQTARGHDGIAMAAIASLAIQSNLPPNELAALDRLGNQCDRLSDLLCGALLPHLDCNRFAVDLDRSVDFARTFGRRPGLVRVPVRKAIASLPGGRLLFNKVAEEAERALIECLPTAASYRSSSPSPITDLTEMFAPKILPFPVPDSPSRTSSRSPETKTLVFSNYSFAKLFRKDR